MPTPRPVRSVLLVPALAAALALALAACGPPGASPTSAAVVNGETIPIAAVESRFASASADPQLAEQLAADETGEMGANVQAQILTQLIRTVLIRQGADELGVEVTDADVATRTEELIEQFGGQDAFDEVVEEANLTPEEVEEQIRELVYQEQVEEALTARIEVTDADVQAFYQENRGQRYEQVTARHILTETEEEAIAALERLDDGEDFADVAADVSIDPGSGERGGDLGSFGRGQMVPEFEQAAFDAEIGEVIGPVESEFGFHIIEVSDREERSLSEVREEIHEELQQVQAQEAVQAWLQDRLAEAEVTVNPRFGAWDAEMQEVVVGDPLGDVPQQPGPGEPDTELDLPTEDG